MNLIVLPVLNYHKGTLMSKKIKSKKQLKSNLYETDIEELDLPCKIKHCKKEKTKKQDYKSSLTLLQKIPDIVPMPPISNKEVHCKCNKCGNSITGILINTIFSPISNLVTPFITYTCSSCHHSGCRSVKEGAMSPEEFEKIYF